MSHFTVLVIGENPEKQLEPFDESIEVKEYVCNEVEKEDIERFKNCYLTKNDISKLSLSEIDRNMNLSLKELYRKYGNDWNGNCWKRKWNLKKLKRLWIETSTYNPNSKWDWYSLGGRWYGFFKVKNIKIAELGKPGIQKDQSPRYDADSTRKYNIDIDFMRKDAIDMATERYQEARMMFRGLPKNKSWDEIKKEHNDIEKARNAYWKQARCEIAQHNNFFYDRMGPDEFLIDSDSYLEKAHNEALQTFAILKDGEWYEKGNMGWTEKFNDIFNSIDDNELLSIYDCHI